MISRIGLDQDGVCFNWDDRTRGLYVERFGVPDWGPSVAWDTQRKYVTPEMDQWYYEPTTLARVFGEGDAYPGASEGSEALTWMTDRLTIITKGPIGAEEPKKAWLRQAKIAHDDFVFLSMDENKSSVSCEVYIDDGSHVIDELFDHTDAHLILVDQPWNRETSAPESEGHLRVERVQGWSGIVDAVRRVWRASSAAATQTQTAYEFEREYTQVPRR